MNRKSMFVGRNRTCPYGSSLKGNRIEHNNPGRYTPVILLLYSWGSSFGVPSKVPLSIISQLMTRTPNPKPSCPGTVLGSMILSWNCPGLYGGKRGNLGSKVRRLRVFVGR